MFWVGERVRIKFGIKCKFLPRLEQIEPLFYCVTPCEQKEGVIDAIRDRRYGGSPYLVLFDDGESCTYSGEELDLISEEEAAEF